MFCEWKAHQDTNAQPIGPHPITPAPQIVPSRPQASQLNFHPSYTGADSSTVPSGQTEDVSHSPRTGERQTSELPQVSVRFPTLPPKAWADERRRPSHPDPRSAAARQLCNSLGTITSESRCSKTNYPCASREPQGPRSGGRCPAQQYLPPMILSTGDPRVKDRSPRHENS
jgi:hypothetical protein